MGPKPKPMPIKYCAYCGKQIVRKRLANRMESVWQAVQRKYCDRYCAAKALSKAKRGVKRATPDFSARPKPTSTDMEEWRPIPGYEGYFVSSLGRVWSNRSGKGRALTQTQTRFGYLQARLPDGNHWIHRLVLKAFVGPRPAGMYTRHLDGDKTNNHVNNLRWGTPRENTEDQRRHGTMLTGENAARAKLTDAQVAEIREMAAKGDYSPSQIGRHYGITRNHVWRIVTGRAR